jgi:hypothetical protein
MNECEQIHPLLRGYLGETLSARDKRLVARHLNLCASARRELDRLRNGALKSPIVAVEAPSEPWDLRILRWLFKTPKPAPRPLSEASPKRARSTRNSLQAMTPSPRPTSLWKPILSIVLIFVGLALLTHFIQNASENRMVKGAKRWLSKNGYHILGVTSSLELVLDLTGLPQWSGNAAPVAVPFNALITDAAHFKIYWQILQPGVALPPVDFNKHALAVVGLGSKATAGYSARFKRAENYTDKTVLWYDESSPGATGASPILTRPWALQLVPKPPAQEPVLIQKIQ